MPDMNAMNGKEVETGLRYEQGALCFDNRPIEELVNRLGIPFWLVSERLLLEGAENIRQWFVRPDGGPVRIYYSAKTNCEIAVLSILHKAGLEAEIACGHELELCLRAGFDASRMCFDGPYKRPADLRAALKAGLEIMNADSIEDARRIAEAAKETGRKAQLTFRLNLGIKGILPDLAERYIGKFGVPSSKALAAYREATRLDGVEIAGVSTHIGSQITKIEAYTQALERMFNLAETLEREGMKVREINLGGGFPSISLGRITFLRAILGLLGMHKGVLSAPLELYGKTITSTFVRRLGRLKNNPILSIEPGRSVVSAAGVFVAPVVAVKDDWVFVDASVNYLPESFFFAQRRFLPVKEAAKKRCKKRYNLAGSSLSSADVLGLGVLLPDIKEGDLLVLLDTGAYTMSRANRFTTLCPPVYLLPLTGDPRMIRRAEETSDVLSPMVP